MLSGRPDRRSVRMSCVHVVSGKHDGTVAQHQVSGVAMLRNGWILPGSRSAGLRMKGPRRLFFG